LLTAVRVNSLATVHLCHVDCSIIVYTFHSLQTVLWFASR